MKKSYWGKFTKVRGVMTRQYIGPMTREEMKERHDEFRHIQCDNPPEHLIIKRFKE